MIAALRRISPRPLDALGVAILLGFTTAAWFVGVAPMLRAHAAERRIETRLDALRAELATAERAAELAAQRAADAQARLEKVDIRPTSTASVNERLATIVDIADAQGLAIERVEPGQPAVGEVWIDVPIQIAGRCDPTQLVGFLATLRAQAPETAVHRINLQAVNTGDARSVSVALGAVWRGPKPAAGPAPAAPAPAAPAPDRSDRP